MKRPRLPSTTALATFESAARHLNFRRAADELHLTQGAVSQQVRQLEELLGVALFARVRQRVLLTPDCGFATFADTPIASAAVAEAKLGALVKAEVVRRG